MTGLVIRVGSRNLVKLAEDWRWKVTLGRKMGEMIPGYYLEVKYEELVHRPAATLTEICDFIGEKYESSMLDFHEDAESEMPETSLRWHRSSVAAPNPEKVQSWRSSMNREDLVIQRILVRHGFSRDLADLLVEDLKRCIDYFKRNPVIHQGNEQDSGGFKHA